jgi:hypothetical protein
MYDKDINPRSSKETAAMTAVDDHKRWIVDEGTSRYDERRPGPRVSPTFILYRCQESLFFPGDILQKLVPLLY